MRGAARACFTCCALHSLGDPSFAMCLNVAGPLGRMNAFMCYSRGFSVWVAPRVLQVLGPESRRPALLHYCHSGTEEHADGSYSWNATEDAAIASTNGVGTGKPLWRVLSGVVARKISGVLLPEFLS